MVATRSWFWESTLADLRIFKIFSSIVALEVHKYEFFFCHFWMYPTPEQLLSLSAPLITNLTFENINNVVNASLHCGEFQVHQRKLFIFLVAKALEKSLDDFVQASRQTCFFFILIWSLRASFAHQLGFEKFSLPNCHISLLILLLFRGFFDDWLSRERFCYELLLFLFRQLLEMTFNRRKNEYESWDCNCLVLLSRDNLLTRIWGEIASDKSRSPEWGESVFIFLKSRKIIFSWRF